MMPTALRSLLRARWFALGAAATFALGIGINVAVFSSVDRLLFRQLPYADPDRLFLMAEVDLESGRRLNVLPARYVAEARERLSGIEMMATLGDSSDFFVTPDMAEPVIRLSGVTWRMLEIGGVRPVLGRGFLEADEQTGVQVVVLTHEGWQSRYGGDPEVLGRRIYRRALTMEIVGVLAPGYIPSGGFIDTNASGLYLMQEVRTVLANGNSLPPTVRLRPEISREAAEAELDALVVALDAETPDRGVTGRAIRLIPIREAMFGRYRTYILLVVTASSLVLLVACANLAGLFLVRGQSRLWDAAVRSSLGATRGQLMRSALAESALVCGVGAALALLTLEWSARTLEALVPPIFARFSTSGPDLRVVLFALMIAAAASVAAALVPAVMLGRVDALPVLQRGHADRGVRVRSGRWLLMAEAAIGVVLVAGAAVTARSFITLASTELGFDARDLYLINARFAPGADPDARQDYTRRVLDALALRPDIESAAGAPMLSVLRVGNVPFGPDGPPCCRFPVTAGYFETTRIPLLAGRVLTDADVRDRAEVAVLNEAGAERLFPGTAPSGAVGRIIRFEGEPAREVVGVVGNTRRAHDDDITPALYLPLTSGGSGLIVARARPGVPLIHVDVRAIVEATPGAELIYAWPMESMYRGILEAPRFRAALFASFAVVALVIAMVGLYAVASFEVASRQREIGVRLALGASRADVIRLVVTDAVRPVLVGGVAGLVLAFWAAGFVEAFLYQVDARDPATLGLVAVVLAIAALVAAWFPASHAARTDPAAVLRAH